MVRRILLALTWLLLAGAPLDGLRGASASSDPIGLAGLAPTPLEIPAALRNDPPYDRPRLLHLPAGFRVSLYSASPASPRQIAFSRRGVLFAANMCSGEIIALLDRDGDGASGPGEQVLFAGGLWDPHSLFFDGDDLYVGAHDRVVRFTDADGDLAPDGPGVTVASLPTFGDQITRTVIVGADRKLYVGVGSTTNADQESDERRGAILRFELDGSGGTVFARGLRNPVGLAVDPRSGLLWGTDVGVDHLGEDHPLEELNLIRAGAHYGWPLCYEDRQPDRVLYPAEGPAFCPATTPPVATFAAHTTPLGLLFYGGKQFPPEYQGRAFVALRGSSKRQFQAGYGVLSVRLSEDGSTARVEPFAMGWLLDPSRTPDQPGQSWGRPVHLAVGPDGALYLSSDSPGGIYRIWWEGSARATGVSAEK